MDYDEMRNQRRQSGIPSFLHAIFGHPSLVRATAHHLLDEDLDFFPPDTDAVPFYTRVLAIAKLQNRRLSYKKRLIN